MRKLTQEEFLAKAKEIHGEYYDLSKANYTRHADKICVICPKHGEFWIKANKFLMGQGCKKCGIETAANKNRLTQDEFIERAKKLYGDKYDYSKVEYKNFATPVIIICKKHGEFKVKPGRFLEGHSCKKCGIEKVADSKRLTTEEFIKKAKEKHGDKYDYSKTVYVNNRTKVCVICKEHGEFFTYPSSHLSGAGCKICSRIKLSNKFSKTTEQFIKECKELYGDRFDYSKVEYKNNHTKVCIICPKHGEFWITPQCFLRGNNCPKCKMSHLENTIRMLLEHNNIRYEYEKRFDWLGLQSLDFYLPEYNIAIECQGRQHFQAFGLFNKERVQKTKEYDKRKKELCDKNGVKLLYYSELNIKFPYLVYTDKNELLNEILKG